MSTGLHKSIEESEIDSELLDEAPTPSRTLLDVVVDLCDETPKSMIAVSTSVHLPTFAEVSFTEHKIDLAPLNEDRLQREQALRDAGDWTALAYLLLERAEVTGSAQEAANLLVQVADLYANEMNNTPAAQAILAKAMEVYPAHRDAADALERIAGAQGDWMELNIAFRQAAEDLSESNPSAAGELWIRLACAYMVGRRDINRAFSSLSHVRQGEASRVDQYLAIMEREIRERQQLECMIAVCHRVGDQERSARLMSRAIAMSQSVIERAYYHHSIALIEVDRSEDAAAEWHLREALRLDPAHHDARDTLGAFYRERGEFRKAVELLEEARACTADAQRKASYALEAAQIYSDALGENTRAVDLYEVALKVQPNSQQASLPVVARYYEQKRWEELESVLDSLLSEESVSAFSDTERSDLYLKAGTCALELGHFEKARDLFAKCSSLSPQELEAALGAARAHLALDTNSRAIEEIERAVDIHEQLGHTAAQMASTLALSARAHLKIGKQERALALFELCVEQGNEETMGELAELYALRGEHHRAVEMYLKQASFLDSEQRVKVLCQVADILFQTIGDPEAAIDICFQALSIDKESREALHRLAVMYSKTEQWRDAIKTIVRMAGLESGAVRRARYLQAAGTIACQENQTLEAVALLNKAIDAYGADTVMSVEAPTRASSFECFDLIISALEKDENWRGVEENYRKMICRLEPGDPYEGAGSDQLEKAIERRRVLLEAEPHIVEHYKALRGLYVRTRQMDRVWCVCRALDHLGVADDRELGFFRRNLPKSMVWPTRPFNSEMWSRIRDEEVDADVSRIFGLVSEVIALEDAAPPSQQVRAHDHQFDHLRQIFSGISYVFGLSGFDCFVQSQSTDAVALANLRRGSVLEPTFVLGRDLYQGRHLEHIVNGLGRFLFYGRRSYYLRLALRQPGQLEAAFQAAISLVRPDVPMPRALEPHASRFRAALQRGLHPTWGAKLAKAVNAYLMHSGPSFDVRRWCDGVDATARHASLLLTSDLNTAMSALKGEPHMSGQKLAESRKRLLLASVSEAHMSLREDLGMAFAKS
jgi:tetratricopeptide (TPR) repeat protein